ncbi:hypothetical protein C9I28_02400 [Pseudoduganella armeniaca]|uniref:Uncharacterized protein n=1 Tax=Pseudoduganella armeniaca TaxID=2072590 RepID=A0A2R4C512_9BURK|nr:hypothetical protein C9I28_02400 [Pseudoduganella armeniaca]
MHGGEGGSAWNGATGGTGGSVTLVNVATGATTGVLTLDQIAYAGLGGDSRGGQAGSGGVAVSRLNLRETSAHTVNANVLAAGGRAGGEQSIRSGNGGAGEATLVLQADKAGSVAFGHAGATGGGWADMPADTFGKAGNAVASSLVQADRLATSEAVAIGGTPRKPLWKQSGNADAFARAVSNHEAKATASGTGTVAIVRAEAVGGTGTTSAVASARASQATVSAYSSAHGAASNTAQAEASGAKSTVKAESLSTGQGGTRVTTTGYTVQKDGVNDGARSGASMGGKIYALPQQFAPEEPSPTITYNMTYATSYATALPDAGAATATLAATPTVAEAFHGARVIGMGLASGVAYTYDKPVNYTGITTANFQFDTTSGGMLTLGLLDSLTYLSGFSKLELSISNHGTEIFTQTFTSLQDAELFFNDRVLNLGMLAAGSQDLLVTTGFTLTRPSGFGFTYALGISAVPEPQTWLLLLLGTSVILLRQRRRQ